MAVCTNLADSPLGLCPWHGSRYQRDKRPGRATAAVVVVAPLRTVRPAGPDRLRRRGGVSAVVRHHAGTVVARADQPAGSAPTGSCGDQVGPVHPHPARPAHPMGPGVDPLAGGHLSRPRRRDADRLPARCRRIAQTSPARSSRRSCTSCDWSTSPQPRPGTPVSSRPTTSVCGSTNAPATST